MAKTLNNDLKMKSEIVQKPISLDDIIHEYSLLASELELGELTEEIEERLEINQENINNKLLGYRYVILNNEAKINSIYKPEIEKLQGRIKKFEHTNDYLKGKVCLAAEIFGIDNKYKSDTINVSSVETVSLDTDEDLVKESIDHIKQCIINNNTEDIEVETNIVKTSLLITASPEVLAEILSVIYNEDNTIMTVEDDAVLNISLDRKAAKELVQSIEEVNINIQTAYDIYKEELSKEEQEKLPKPELRKIAFKGLSLKSSHYPRFS